MKQLNLALVGASGRMGQEILRLCAAQAEIRVLEQVSADSEKKPALLTARGIDVVIDFSTPDGFAAALDWCERNKRALISGTTGLSPELEWRLKSVSRQIPILWASNFSVGVALVAKMLENFSGQKGFDYQVEEFHHRHKKDKPSGTARTLQDKLIQVIGHELPEPVSIRGGEIFGIHRVYAMSSGETIQIEHTAHNRSVFAAGALRAASWIVGREPGLYTMQDMLS